MEIKNMKKYIEKIKNKIIAKKMDKKGYFQSLISVEEAKKRNLFGVK